MTWHRCLLLSLSCIPTIPLQGTVSQLLYTYRTPLHITALALQWSMMMGESAQVIKQYVYRKDINKRLADAAPVLRAFVIERMHRHHVPTTDLEVKINSCETSFGCAKNTIVIPEKYREEFTNVVIKNNNHKNDPKNHPPLTPEEIRALGYFTVTIDHEIAHYKYKHHAKLAIIHPCINLGLQGLIFLAMKRVHMHHAFSPLFLQNKHTFGYLKDHYSLMLSLTITASLGIAPCLQNYMSRSHEKEADLFAFNAASAQDLESYIARNLQDPRHAIKGSTHPTQQDRLNKALDILATKQ